MNYDEILHVIEQNDICNLLLKKHGYCKPEVQL